MALPLAMPSTLHVKAELAVPPTVAEKAWVAPGATVALPGETVTPVVARAAGSREDSAPAAAEPVVSVDPPPAQARNRPNTVGTTR